MTGLVLWFTGLSGSGKSTLAARVADRLVQEGQHVEALDGDEVRKYLSYGLGFSREDRDQNVRRIGFVARVAARSGAFAITAAISPYRAIRDEVRALSPHFCEVYCECPLEVLAERDPKGLYKKALAGEIKNFTGVDDPYEPPLEPEVHLRTDLQSPAECEEMIIARLRELGYLGQGRGGARLAAPYGGELVTVPARALDPSLPRVAIDRETAAGCVALALGYLSPVAGFMPERETEKVLKVGHLERGFAWPRPQTLRVGKGEASLAVGSRVVLRGPDGDLAELGVHEVLARGDGTVLAGNLEAVTDGELGSPAVSEVRRRAGELGFEDPVVLVERGEPNAERTLAVQAMGRAARGLILLAARVHAVAWQRAVAGMGPMLVVAAPEYLEGHPEFLAIAAQNLGGSRWIDSALGKSP